MSIRIFTTPVASIISKTQNKADIARYAFPRNMLVTNIRMIDGSTVKLIEGSDEIDVIRTMGDKVISSHGKIERDPEKNEKILAKIYRLIDKRASEIFEIEQAGINFNG